MTKTQRQHRIAQLLAAVPVTSQAELVGLLTTRGSRRPRRRSRGTSSSSGPSRCARRDGQPDAGPAERGRGGRAAAPEHLRRVLSEWVVEVATRGADRGREDPAGVRARRGLGARPRRAARPRSGRSREMTRSSSWSTSASGGEAVAAELREVAGLEPATARPRRRGRRRPRRSEVDEMARSVVLAYSGGLDTSVAVRWMQEEWDAEVHCVAVDVGQTTTPDPAANEVLVARALAAGAASCTVVDARARDGRGVLRARRSSPTPATRASTRSSRRCRGRSSSGTSSRRRAASAPTPSRTAARARATTRSASTSACARSPRSSRSSPPRGVWGMTRADSVAYAAKWSIPIEATAEKLYSIDENLWGRAIECGAIEDPWAAPPEEPYTLTRVTDDVGRRRSRSRFERGLPGRASTARRSDSTRSSRRSAALAGSRGFGRLDMVESRRVGIKSREVYECPGRARAARRARGPRGPHLGARRAPREGAPRAAVGRARLRRDVVLAAQGRPSTPSSKRPSATSPARCASPSPRPGVLRVVGRRSPVALYDHGLATYDAADTFRHATPRGSSASGASAVQTWAERQGRATRRDARGGHVTLWAGRLDGGHGDDIAAFTESLSVRPVAVARRRRGLGGPRAPGLRAVGLLTADEARHCRARSTRSRAELERDGSSRSSRPTRTSTPRSSGA